MIKRVLSLVLTVCLLTGLLIPMSAVQAASNSVDYSMTDARSLKGSTIENVGEADIIWTKEQYDKNKLNWYILDCYNSRPDGRLEIGKNYGMRMRGNVDSWIALVIKAPGSGTYTMQMTCTEYSYGAELALAYIMPMSDSVTTDTIKDTIQKGGALGSADFYSATATSISSNYNNKTATLGSYTFTEGEEYVFILYASEGYNITGDTAYMTFSKITAVNGNVSSADETEINPLNLGYMITEFGVRGKFGLREVNGYDYYFLPIKGGQMHIYNLDYYCDGDSKTEPYIGSVATGITNAWGCSAGVDGKIYVTGDAKYVYRYDPDTGKGEKLTYSQSYVCGYDVGADKDGNIYIGLNKDNAGVAYYEKATGKFHVYDGLDATGVADDCSAVAWDDQYIYAYLCGKIGSNSTKIIVQVEKATGKLVNKKDVTNKVGTTGHLTGMNVVDGVLFAGSNTVKNMIAIDIESWSFLNIGFSGGIKGNVSEERDGKVYFIGSDGNIYSYAIAKRTATKVSGFSTSQSLLTQENSFVTLDVNQDGKDENVIFTCRPVGNGYPVIYDVFSGKQYSWTDMINAKASAYTSVQDVYPSNDGSNRIFVGGYVTENCAVYNSDTEEYAAYITAGQTDSQLMYKGELYAGNYSSCTLTRVDPNGGNPQKLFTLSGSPYKQKRIHCLAAGEDKIFFSTVPDTYDLGGYLAWYDLKTEEKYAVKLTELNAVLEDEVVLSMAYSGGYLYCGTTIRGGVDSTPSKNSCHFFALDVANKKIVAIQEIPYSCVVSLNADNSGTVWGVISRTLFTVSYKNGSISFAQKFSNDSSTPQTDSEKLSAAEWFGKPIYFSGDYLYVGLGDTGLWKISRSGTGTKISSKITGQTYALGEDGNIYYSSGKSLMLLPLNVSSGDKAAAAAVNAKLDGVLRTAASSSNSALAAAKDAYDKLTNVQKSMVDVAKLNAANRRYVTALINTLPAKISLSNENMVESVLSAYEALSGGQQLRVQNADKLEDAVIQLRVLQGLSADELAIGRVMDRINALPSEEMMTLSDKDAVAAARKAYDALSSSQKKKVTNYSRLTAAETRIKDLEKSADQSAAMSVINMINALPTKLTKADQEKVEAVRQAYDELTLAQQKYVINYNVLITAEFTIKSLVGGHEGSADVDAVIALISEISAVITQENKNTVIAARAAYDTLTAEKQLKVTNYQKLLEAETQMAALENPDGTVGETQPGVTDPSQPGGSADKNNKNRNNLSWLTILVIAGGVLVAAGIAVCVVVVIMETKKQKAKDGEAANAEVPDSTEQIAEEISSAISEEE